MDWLIRSDLQFVSFEKIERKVNTSFDWSIIRNRKWEYNIFLYIWWRNIDIPNRFWVIWCWNWTFIHSIRKCERESFKRIYRYWIMYLVKKHRRTCPILFLFLTIATIFSACFCISFWTFASRWLSVSLCFFALLQSILLLVFSCVEIFSPNVFPYHCYLSIKYLVGSGFMFLHK